MALTGDLRAVAAALLAALALAPPAPVAAFGTINSFGQHAEHERITRWALKSAGFGAQTLGQLAGAKGAFGAVGAPDNPLRGLLDVKAAHCDGGDHLDTPGYAQSKADAQKRLEDCRAWMADHIRQAVSDAAQLSATSPDTLALACSFDGRRRGSAKCDVLEDLGIAFHASEDFYAHTNWVDHPAPGAITTDNPPGLGNTAPAPWLDLRQPAPFPSGLISGCYDGFPEQFHCGGRVAHRNLNKDEGLIDVEHETIAHGETRRGAVDGNFERAVAAAVADTRDKWAFFTEQLAAAYGPDRGRQLVCLVRSDTPAGC